jgi:hypothetical protein
MDDQTERELYIRVWTTLLTLTVALLLGLRTPPQLPPAILAALSYLW